MASFSAEEVIAEINRQAPIVGVDPRHAIALFMAENSGSGKAKIGAGDAVSPKGALGVMQVMPGTARGLQKVGLLPADWKHDPENLTSGVMAGLAAMKDHQSRMKDPTDVFEMAAGYNGSPKVHQAFLNKQPIPAETVDYLRKVAVAAEAQGMKIKPPEFTMTPTESTPTTAKTTSVTTRKNVNDPNVMAAFTNSITDAVDANNTAVEMIINGGTLRADNMAAQKAAIAAGAAAKGEEAAAQAAIEGGSALRREQILAGMNLDPRLTSNEATRAQNSILETDAMLTSMKPEIDKIMGVGLLDNPIEWLINQTILPGAVARYNGVVSTQNAAIDRYKQLASIADGQLSRTAGADADSILRKSVATQQRIAAEAAAAAAELQEKASAATIRDGMVLAQLAGNKASLLQHQVAMSKESQTVKEGESAKDAQLRGQQEALASANKLLKAAGGVEFPSWEAFKAAGPRAMAELSETASTGRFGKDFAESFNFVGAKGNINKMATGGNAEVRAWYLGTKGKVGELISTNEATAEKMGKKFDVNKEAVDAYNAIQAKYQKQASTDMSVADKFNPFKLDYVALSKMPELANNPVAALINQFGPGSKEPQFPVVTEDLILQRLSFAVANQKMALGDASKAITEFYKITTRENAMRTQWALFGLDKPEKTYAVALTIPDGLFSSAKINADMGDVPSVENALVKTVARSYATELYKRNLPEGNALAPPSGSAPARGVGAMDWK